MGDLTLQWNRQNKKTASNENKPLDCNPQITNSDYKPSDYKTFIIKQVGIMKSNEKVDQR